MSDIAAIEASIERPVEHLTAVRPGHIWLAEQRGTSLHPLDRAALASANVVIFERSLAPLVAQALAIGAYAEPLPRTAFPGLISPRSLRFAAEGWSVVQLSETGIGDAATALIRAGTPGDLAVSRIGKSSLKPARIDELCLRDLLGSFGLPDDDSDPSSLVFGPFAGGSPAGVAAAHNHLFTAHGLAG